MKFKIDSRDLEFYRKFGQVTQFPDRFLLDNTISDDIQPIGNVKCACYMVCDLACDEENVQFDVDYLWNNIPNSNSGSDPRDALGFAVKNGLKKRFSTEVVKEWSSYWKAHTGNYDYFDNIRSALMLANIDPKKIYRIGIWTAWYSNWGGTNSIMPVGDKIISYHAYEIKGWDTINGVPMLLVQAWQGYTMWMPRETLNKALSPLGCSTAVLSTSDIDAKRQKTIIESLKDGILNLWLSFTHALTPSVQDEIINQQTQIDNTMIQNNIGPNTDIQPTNADKLYALSKSLIGQHLTLDDTIPKAYGCAESVSKVLKVYGCPIPDKGLASTNVLEGWLVKNAKEITTPIKGCIIISVSFTGILGARGHVGVIGEQAIMSNSSETGLWQTDWTLDGWLGFYKTKEKLRTRYFTL